MQSNSLQTRSSNPTLVRTTILAVLLLGIVATWFFFPWQANNNIASAQSNRPGSYKWDVPRPLNAKRAFGYLEQICKFGSRTSGTVGMQKQQQLLAEHFKKLGATLEWQTWTIRHPETGNPVELKNLIVHWNPDVPQRKLLCTHYDTRPYPSRDLKNPKGLFIGANDSASGTALFMEMGHAMSELGIKTGVDFVFFDAEEFMYFEDSNGYFIGSTEFSRLYVENGKKNPSGPRYTGGVLLDMVADSDLQLCWERNSFTFAKPLAVEIWDIAKRLKVREFEPSIKYELRDDHLPLNQIAQIPVIDLIDFDYPHGSNRPDNYWHTMADTPDKCSGISMVKVAAVLLEWVKK